MELDAASIGDLRSGGLTMHVNKVHHVTTIDRVAKELGENEDWLFDVANEMDTEDGVIWVYGVGDDGVMAFTDFGIENLIDLIKIHKDDPTLLKRGTAAKIAACGLRRMLTGSRPCGVDGCSYVGFSFGGAPPERVRLSLRSKEKQFRPLAEVAADAALRVSDAYSGGASSNLYGR